MNLRLGFILETVHFWYIQYLDYDDKLAGCNKPSRFRSRITYTRRLYSFGNRSMNLPVYFLRVFTNLGFSDCMSLHHQ